ncbi:hypothetical protein Slin15195_G062540 [Septoria linicola]|uniref:Uncharacterized protein n=1 Tax=Septoria linicola TaxID=215465 RepID=A0A9Q9EJE2_9PEZI|nr:hypothetical protein Slin15195_G062540 [Septoria linicola]
MAKLQMLFMALACLAANVCANCNKPDSCYTVITNKFNWDTFDAAVRFSLTIHYCAQSFANLE